MARTALLSYSDLERIPEDGLRRELIGGELFVSPSPVPSHQDIVAAIFVAFRSHARLHGDRAFVGPIDLLFGPHDVTAPDVVYVASDRLSLIGEKNIPGAPSIVVEVLSPSTSRIDRVHKRALYAESGVPEYWIVSGKTRSIEQCSDPHGDKYRNTQALAGDAAIRSTEVPGLEISLSAIFE